MVATSFATTSSFKEFQDICSQAAHVLKSIDSTSARRPKPGNFRRGGASSGGVHTPKADRTDADHSTAALTQGKSGGRQCYECRGFGHLARDCPLKRRERRNALKELEARIPRDEDDSGKESA